MPRLLYFVTEDWYFCSHRLNLARAAREAGYEVTVVTRVKDHGDIIRRAGIELVPFEISRRSMNVLQELRTLIRLTALYRKISPDIVHHVAMKPVLYGTIAARLAGIPHVVNAMAGMGWLFTSTRSRASLIKPFVRLAFRILLSSTSFIVQNPDDAALLNKMGLTDIRLIRGSGVDILAFSPHPEPEECSLIILPARMLWDKGVGEFVEAAKYLKAKAYALRFALVGKPDPENPTSISAAQLVSWQEAGIVEWWGQREDMARVYAQCCIVCLPSYREGLPKSLLEAASCARPIVATDVPGCREIVRNEVNGILVPARESAPLARALERLIEDPSLRRRMGENGRQLVENEFSQEKIIDLTLLIYKKLMA